MQRILLAFLFILSFSSAFGQSLEGEWEGWCTSKYDSKDTAIMKLYFKRNPDSTYDVYSFSKFKNYKAECKVLCKVINEHTIYLEEKELIRANYDDIYNMFQKMTLEIESDFKSMKGKWFYKDGKLRDSGDMAFTKKT